MSIADRFVRINDRIRAREIRVVDDEGKQLGIMPPYEAIKIARERGLDLVEVSPTANPPVCRIINYGKFLYQQSKRQHEARKHQKSTGLKEVKFSPRTGEHDLEVKRNQMLRFLQDGSKVKATVEFRGREMAHRDLGWKLLTRLVEDIGEAGLVEARPKQEGRSLFTIVAPKKPGGKSAKPTGASAAALGTGSRPSTPPKVAAAVAARPAVTASVAAAGPAPTAAGSDKPEE
ncbi:MAG TPA: translation initiation factor IF-3 [Terriglobia bacterium]|nr:translation initiation factor IF-3 [Terriglobia bacterium]